MLSRRRLLLAMSALAAGNGLPARAALTYPEVTPRVLRFPEDHGAHPDFRTEWWYLTGWLNDPGRRDAPRLGFQVTFFRARTDLGPDNPSAFAARQLIIAHAALADPSRGRLLVDERIARTGFGLVEAAAGDTSVRLESWSLERDPVTDVYRAKIAARGFTLDLHAAAVGPPWLQGDGGLSRKGPLAAQASYYYSRPQLRVTAEIAVAPGVAPGVAPEGAPTLLGSGFSRAPLQGIAWLDHEWSSQALASDAAGWDWAGMNLDDGSALLAFQVRRQGAAAGETPLRRYAAFRGPDGRVRLIDPATVSFRPLQEWTSARSRGTWPVAQRITVGDRSFDTTPLMPDQELDSRLTTGAVYWEGASTLLEAGRPVGRGYLEMTGYVLPLKL